MCFYCILALFAVFVEFVMFGVGIIRIFVVFGLLVGCNSA